jgi:hypothetical protein
MIISMSEKPLAVSVVDFDGEQGAERPTFVRYTFGLSDTPDDLWMLCLHLPSTKKIVPEEVKSAVWWRGDLLDIECAPEQLASFCTHVLRWIDRANKQQEEALADETKEDGPTAADKRRHTAVLERLNVDLERGLDITPGAGEPSGEGGDGMPPTDIGNS